MLLSHDDHNAPIVQGVAKMLGFKANPLETAYRIWLFVRKGIPYAPDAPKEKFVSPERVLQTRLPCDCDDHARLVKALLLAANIPARFRWYQDNDGNPVHVVAEAHIGDRWIPLETTDLRIGFGEDPANARP
jgi:transglutaminase-like putative cysteine protease